MSRVAVLADIHANPYAFDAVLRDLEARRVDEVVINGDLVGRGPHGSAVIERVRRLDLRSTRGNHEDYLLSFRRKEVPEDWLEVEEWACSRWMAAELSEDDEAFIDALPFTLTSELEPELRLFHGSPRSYNEGLGHWSSDETLRDYLSDIEESVLVVAHTHRAMRWDFDDGMIVNVGSVGLPFDGDWRAQYAIFDGTRGEFTVEMHRVEYDRESFLSDYEETGFLEAGEATSRLLRLEVETARSHVVPYIKWAEATDRRPLLRHVDDFLDFYDAEASLADLMKALEKAG